MAMKITSLIVDFHTIDSNHPQSPQESQSPQLSILKKQLKVRSLAQPVVDSQ